MKVRVLDELVRRAQAAGYPDVPTYCLELESALRWIANGESGVWGQKAREVLDGER